MVLRLPGLQRNFKLTPPGPAIQNTTGFFAIIDFVEKLTTARTYHSLAKI